MADLTVGPADGSLTLRLTDEEAAFVRAFCRSRDLAAIEAAMYAARRDGYHARVESLRAAADTLRRMSQGGAP